MWNDLLQFDYIYIFRTFILLNCKTIFDWLQTKTQEVVAPSRRRCGRWCNVDSLQFDCFPFLWLFYCSELKENVPFIELDDKIPFLWDFCIMFVEYFVNSIVLSQLWVNLFNGIQKHTFISEFLAKVHLNLMQNLGLPKNCKTNTFLGGKNKYEECTVAQRRCIYILKTLCCVSYTCIWI